MASSSISRAEAPPFADDLGLGFVGRCSVELRTNQAHASTSLIVITNESENDKLAPEIAVIIAEISQGSLSLETDSPTSAKVDLALKADAATGLRPLRLQASLPLSLTYSATPSTQAPMLPLRPLGSLQALKSKATGSSWFGKIKAIGAKVADTFEQLERVDKHHSVYFNSTRYEIELPVASSSGSAKARAEATNKPHLVRVSFAQIKVAREAVFALGEEEDDDFIAGCDKDERSSLSPMPKFASQLVSESKPYLN